MACGEYGPGRMAEPDEIVAAAAALLSGAAAAGSGLLVGRRALVTSGPTHEPIDPVRYIANRSSGKQGHAIAAAIARLGAETTLISGPSAEPDPAGVATVHVETAREMAEACERTMPVDIAVCAAAVADWRVDRIAGQKLKKTGGGPPTLALVPNPDILAGLAQRNAGRPALVIGFAAETENVVAHARDKRRAKGCDWIVANDVSPGTGIMGGPENRVHLITADGHEEWPPLPKAAVAARIAARIAAHFGQAGGCTAEGI
jgi:phosphopantothenoylcysteine decarboxylase/phosphopantothenate--cysteine ligase